MNKHPKRRFLLVIAVTLMITVGVTTWWKFYRDVPQPQWIRANQQLEFFYGAVGSENVPGIPYWIWLALPRMFPEHMPGQGGYASLGLSWEQGREMPVGFAKKTIGYVRVTGNCALCHAALQSAGPADPPTVIIAARGHSTNIQSLLTFLSRCARDPRFNADEILAEVADATRLSVIDRLLYRYILIPRAKRALLHPGPAIFNEALLAHSREPHSAFSQQGMKDLQAWLNAQRH